ncbi:MAG: hypothetical protein ACI9UV_002155 [Algoriphagus sp.]|jgi:hypothetical protein
MKNYFPSIIVEIFFPVQISKTPHEKQTIPLGNSLTVGNRANNSNGFLVFNLSLSKPAFNILRFI